LSAKSNKPEHLDMNAAKTCLLRFLAGDDGVTWGAILWDTGAPAPQGLWEAGAHHTGGQVGGGQVGGGPAGGRDGDGGDAAPQGSARLLAGYTFTLIAGSCIAAGCIILIAPE